MIATITINANVDGKSMTFSRGITATGNVAQDLSLAAGAAGTINGSAVVALTAGHGLTTGTYDIYWTGGSRLDCTGTVDENNMTLTGGAGDALPTSGSVVVGPQVAVDIDVVGNLVSAILAECPNRCRIALREADHSAALDEEIAKGEGYAWPVNNSVNPLADETVAEAVASNAETTAATLALRILYDSQS